MSAFNKLMRALEEELLYQDKLLKLLTRERAAIVKLDQVQLQKIADQKADLFEDAREVGARRNAVIGAITGEDKPKGSVKLAEILTKCPSSDTRKKLETIGSALKKAAQSVYEINNENSEMIKRSIGLVVSTIAIFRSAPEADLPAYNESGNLRRSQDSTSSRKPGTIISEA